MNNENKSNNVYVEDIISGPYFSLTYDSNLEGIKLTVFNVEEEDKDKAIKDAFDYIESKYGKEVSLTDNRIMFNGEITEDEKFEIIDLLTDYKPFQSEELKESVVKEDSVGSIAWSDLNETEQSVANKAFDIIKNSKEDVEKAVRTACDEVDSDSCNFDRVLDYVQSSRTVTELCKDECTNPGSVPSVPGKHKKPTKDEDNKLELDEDFVSDEEFTDDWLSFEEPDEDLEIDITHGRTINDAEDVMAYGGYYGFHELDEDYEFWGEFDDPVDLDNTWANAYGGDREYCKHCGHKLTHDEFGAFCPTCDGDAEQLDEDY